VVAGVVDRVIDPAAMPHILAGRIRAIAARGRDDGPHPELPGVPRLKALGAPTGTETWFGVLAPAGTPAAIVERVAGVIERLTRAPGYEATMLPLSMYPLFLGPKAFAGRTPRDLAVYRDNIAKTGIRAAD